MYDGRISVFGEVVKSFGRGSAVLRRALPAKRNFPCSSVDAAAETPSSLVGNLGAWKLAAAQFAAGRRKRAWFGEIAARNRFAVRAGCRDLRQWHEGAFQPGVQSADRIRNRLFNLRPLTFAQIPLPASLHPWLAGVRIPPAEYWLYQNRDGPDGIFPTGRLYVRRFFSTRIRTNCMPRAGGF